MKIYLLTLFPKMFIGVFTESIIRKAQDKKLLEINLINIRDFAKDRHKTVDDKPYGGGKGMILKVDILVEALESIKPKPYTVLLSPSGKEYNQEMARALSKKKSMAIICGRYEGVDARVEKYVNTTLAIGSFVLTGGEIAAMAIVDSVARLIPGVIKKESTETESFSKISNSPFDSKLAQGEQSQTSNLLEYPQYTRPDKFGKLKVPQVLLSGNHQEIAQWRLKQARKRTKKFRPDLLKKIEN